MLILKESKEESELLQKLREQEISVNVLDDLVRQLILDLNVFLILQGVSFVVNPFVLKELLYLRFKLFIDLVAPVELNH